MKPRTLFLGCVAMLLLNSASAFAKEDRTKTFRCNPKGAVSIMLDGTLNKEIGETSRKTLDNVVLDSDGDITFPATHKRERWVVQKTSVDGDYVFFPRIDSHRGQAVADGVTKFFLIHSAPNEQTRFMAFDLSYVVTGTCALLK
jgi:hypothetical protein